MKWRCQLVHQSDGREHAQHQWLTVPGRGHHMVAVHRRRSGQGADKRAGPLLLHSHSRSLLVYLASRSFSSAAEKRHHRRAFAELTRHHHRAIAQ